MDILNETKQKLLELDPKKDNIVQDMEMTLVGDVPSQSTAAQQKPLKSDPKKGNTVHDIEKANSGNVPSQSTAAPQKPLKSDPKKDNTVQDIEKANSGNVQSQSTAATDKNPKANTSVAPDPNKKKQAAFLDREAQIKHVEAVDQIELLRAMKIRFEAGYKRWESRCKTFELANFSVTLMVILLQLSQVVIFQIPSAHTPATKTAIATILPALTGALLAIQLKLAWAQKGAKCKKAAKLYKQLATHVRYRLEVAEVGGEVTDSIKLWNIAMLSENRDIPAFLTAY